MRTRSKKTDGYEAEIISWLRASPDLSSAQVMDWLQERYGKIDICEGTIRNYVSEIRENMGTFVLSHSRHKYVEWLDRPFTTKDVIACHERAFAYLGGMTKELVYTTRSPACRE